MKTRLPMFGLTVLTAGLVACGGGGGGGNGMPPPQPTPTPTPTVTPSPTPAPTVGPCASQVQAAAGGLRRLSSSPRPIGAGDSFSYSGTFLQTTVRSAPCPEPTATAAAAVSMQVTDTATTAPNGQSGVDSKSVETDAFATSTTTTTTDSIEQETASAALLFSMRSTDSNNNTIATTYSTPQLIDELPETAGQAWGPNDPAATIAESFADGTSSSRTVNADGTYTETDNGPSNTNASITVNADGSGVYDVYGSYELIYAAPANNNIVLNVYVPPPAPGPLPAPTKTRNIPQWFPIPVTLDRDTFVDNGPQTFTQACTIPASVTTATQGDQIVETLVTTDPVLGYTDARTTTSYDVAGLGQVCIVITDTLKSYYDYSQDTTRADYQTTDGNPLQTQTIGETLSLRASPTVNDVGRRPERTGIPRAVVIARTAAIDEMRAVQRERRIRAMAHLLFLHSPKGGLK